MNFTEKKQSSISYALANNHIINMRFSLITAAASIASFTEAGRLHARTNHEVPAAAAYVAAPPAPPAAAVHVPMEAMQAASPHVVVLWANPGGGAPTHTMPPPTVVQTVDGHAQPSQVQVAPGTGATHKVGI